MGREEERERGEKEEKQREGEDVSCTWLSTCARSEDSLWKSVPFSRLVWNMIFFSPTDPCPRPLFLLL